jgi:TPR repeat protein
MKRILLLLAIVLMVIDLSAKQYKILSVRNPSSIDIGGKAHKAGDYFDDSEPITWADESQVMAIQSQDDKRTTYLTGSSMKSKNAKTVKDYIMHSGKLSGKDGENWINLEARNKEEFTDRRIALVIGNCNYTNNTPLQNPGNDVTAVSKQLQQLGFDVIVLYDGSYEEMNYVLDVFRHKAVKGLYDFALFYYSGHGIQYGSHNWLLPIDANLVHPSDLEGSCVEGQALLSKVEGTECTNMVVILDACRTEKINWVDETGKAIESSTSSQVNMDPRTGMLLAYSTKSGNISNDVLDENLAIGPYANALTNCLKIKDLSLDELFTRVKDLVVEATSQSQIPIYTNSTLKKYYINGKNAIVPKYASGMESSTNQSAYLSYIIEQANEGDSDAEFQLGKCYEDGLGDVTKDYATAVQWYMKAAKKGNADAQNKIGIYYFGKKDYKEALKWYESSAKGGNAKARYNMGMMFMSKEYGMQDEQRGLNCYSLAAEAGLAEAQFELGLCYYYGIGTIKYSTKAVMWFERAARQGYDEAQYMLGHCYLAGDGVEKNNAQAFDYFKQAADQNFAPAQYWVSECFNKGYGVEANLSQAILWCRKAADQGYARAVRKLQLLEP